jgi:hypothetical protein
MRSTALLALAAALAGCHGASAPPDDPVDLVAAATAAQQPAGQTDVIASAKQVAELFVAEDPTIDPTQTAGRNGDLVAARLTARTAGCAQAMISHTAGDPTVTVDFGMGCTFGPLTVSGQVAATLSKVGSAIQVAFTFTGFQVNQLDLTGTLTASTSDGANFGYSGALTSSSTAWMFTGTIAVDPSGFTIDGMNTTSGESGMIVYTLDQVHHTNGACYADAGKITFMTDAMTVSGKSVTVGEVVTFDAQTPSTGQATLVIGSSSTMVTLPAYGTCPHP